MGRPPSAYYRIRATCGTTVTVPRGKLVDESVNMAVVSLVAEEIDPAPDGSMLHIPGPVAARAAERVRQRCA
jgi:hypothetical protein